MSTRGLRQRLTACMLAVVAVTSGCSDLHRTPTQVEPPLAPTATYDGSTAEEWFDLSLGLTQRTPGFTPPVASRAFGYLGLGLYETVVPGMPEYRSLAGILNGLAGLPAPSGAGYHFPAAANAALARLMRKLYPTASAADLAAIDALESRLASEAASGADAAVIERSVLWGRAMAEAIFAYSITDGGHEGFRRNFPASYVPPAGSGLWVPTPRPGGLPPQSALQPFWGSNRPFCLPASGNPNIACDPGPHTAYAEDPNSDFYREALEVYTTVNGLTAEQDAIARFWADDPGVTATPPGHSISILTQVLQQEEATLAIAAEGYAKVGLAVADAFVSCWYTKYRYNLLRPVTFVQRFFDPNWMPLLATPPFPEYSSGHSVQSAAAAAVLTSLFGESYAFTDRTHERREPPLPSRSFTSFDAAASEAAVSRLYGGIHYRAAIDKGLLQGQAIGRMVSTLPFRR